MENVSIGKTNLQHSDQQSAQHRLLDLYTVT
jgi:hypothetical protein